MDADQYRQILNRIDREYVRKMRRLCVGHYVCLVLNVLVIGLPVALGQSPSYWYLVNFAAIGASLNAIRENRRIVAAVLSRRR